MERRNRRVSQLEAGRPVEQVVDLSRGPFALLADREVLEAVDAVRLFAGQDSLVLLVQPFPAHDLVSELARVARAAADRERVAGALGADECRVSRQTPVDREECGVEIEARPVDEAEDQLAGLCLDSCERACGHSLVGQRELGQDEFFGGVELVVEDQLRGFAVGGDEEHELEPVEVHESVRAAVGAHEAAEGELGLGQAVAEVVDVDVVARKLQVQVHVRVDGGLVQVVDRVGDVRLEVGFEEPGNLEVRAVHEVQHRDFEADEDLVRFFYVLQRDWHGLRVVERPLARDVAVEQVLHPDLRGRHEYHVRGVYLVRGLLDRRPDAPHFACGSDELDQAVRLPRELAHGRFED